MAYRPPALGSTRRRMIGPREMRSASSLLGGGSSRPLESSYTLPFASMESPSPQRRSFTAHPSIPSSTMEEPTSAPQSPVLPLRSESPSLSSSINSKRSRPLVEASPRPTPRKKVAAIGEDSTGPRAPSSLSQPLFPANRIGSGSKEKRIPSGSHIKIRSRRVTSNSSTIRGPPTPPRKEIVPDVFSDPAEELDLGEDDARPDVHMVDVGRNLLRAAEIEPPTDTITFVQDETTPFGRLRSHINELRLKLVREAANKENSRIASPSSLSRSPHTRNVFVSPTPLPRLLGPY